MAGSAQEAGGGRPYTARADAEEHRREKAVARLVEVITEAGLPLARVAGEARDPARVLAAAGRGRRCQTIWQRIRTWERVRLWLLARTGRPWPVTVSPLLEYLAERADEPCARSALTGVLSALAFVEVAGGVAFASRLSTSAVLKNVVEDLSRRLAEKAPKLPRKAPRHPVMILMAEELHVMNPRAPRYERMYAWWLAVKTYASLRFDDHRGMVPSRLALTARGLTGVLVRSKTSGPGRTKEFLPLCVSRGAYVAAPQWLEVGFELWCGPDQPCADRDYFLQVPTSDFSAVQPVEAVYRDAMTLTRCVRASLRQPVWTDGQWTVTEERLLHPEAIGYWSEHSGRADMPSWGYALEFPEEWLQALGNWSAASSESYVRTHRARVEQVQCTVAEAIRHGRKRQDILDEEEAFTPLIRFLRQRGLSVDEVEEQIDRLAYFAPPNREGQPVQTDEEAPEEDAAGGAVPRTPYRSRGTGAAASATLSDPGQETPRARPAAEVRSVSSEAGDEGVPREVADPELGSWIWDLVGGAARAMPEEADEEIGSLRATPRGDEEEPEAPVSPDLSRGPASGSGGATPERPRKRRLRIMGAEAGGETDLGPLAPGDWAALESRAWAPQDTQDVPTVGYASSITRHYGQRRLHRLGGCWRKPGADYLRYEIYKEGLPDPTLYRCICRDCWPRARSSQNEEPGGVAAESDSTWSGSAAGPEGAELVGLDDGAQTPGRERADETSEVDSGT